MEVESDKFGFWRTPSNSIKFSVLKQFQTYLAPDAKVMCVWLSKLQQRNLHLKLHQNTEFHGIRRDAPKSESVAEFDGIRRDPSNSESFAGDLHLTSDAKVLYVGLNGLQHRNVHMKLY